MKQILKRISFLALALTITLGMGVNAADVHAASPSVTYEGNAKEFVFETDSTHHLTDLFSDMKGVMPGDEITETIQIRNESAKDIDAEIFLKAAGPIEDSEFLSQLGLTVTDMDGNKLFDNTADQTDKLSDWTSLGVFSKGETTDLTVKLSVPLTMGNDFQDRLGALEWKFKVAEYPVSSGIVDDKGDADTDGDKTDVVQTGDTSDAGLYAALGAGALILLLYAVISSKKKSK